MSARRCLVRIGVGVGLVCVLAGCGVPADPAPTDIPPEQVPFGLLSPTTSTSAPVEGVRVRVFLIKDGRLAPVDRKVPAPASPSDAIAAISAGPTPREATNGLRTALAAPVASVRVSAGIVTVRLSGQFADAPIREQILALGQLVYTATALDGIRGVEVSVDHALAQVPTAQGSLKRGPLTRADFAAVAPSR
ncbi:MAG TPA: GerMN domain-containing protein [Actinomycetes bacterium]|jgi:hypothetical protein|nr:GerMN domain-containing protein [Actinomycetes bacterium]